MLIPQSDSARSFLQVKVGVKNIILHQMIAWHFFVLYFFVCIFLLTISSSRAFRLHVHIFVWHYFVCLYFRLLIFCYFSSSSLFSYIPSVLCPLFVYNVLYIFSSCYIFSYAYFRLLMFRIHTFFHLVTSSFTHIVVSFSHTYFSSFQFLISPFLHLLIPSTRFSARVMNHPFFNEALSLFVE